MTMNEKNENVLYLPLTKKWFLMIKEAKEVCKAMEE